MADWIRRHHPLFAVTECGWSTATRSKARRFPLCFLRERVPGWTDADVAKFALWELDFWKEQGALLYSWYQLNDGPDPEDAHNVEGRFGVRALDGTAKLVLDAMKEWRNAA